MSPQRSSTLPVVTQAEFTPAPLRLLGSGLRGWICCVINGLQVDGITLRRTAAGSLTLVCPARRDLKGTQFPYVLPVDSVAHACLDQQIFAALKPQGWLR